MDLDLYGHRFYPDDEPLLDMASLVGYQAEDWIDRIPNEDDLGYLDGLSIGPGSSLGQSDVWNEG